MVRTKKKAEPFTPERIKALLNWVVFNPISTLSIIGSLGTKEN